MELARLVAQGDEQAAMQWVKRVSPSLLRTATLIVQERHLAEDVVQDTLISALKAVLRTNTTVRSDSDGNRALDDMVELFMIERISTLLVWDMPVMTPNQIAASFLAFDSELTRYRELVVFFWLLDRRLATAVFYGEYACVMTN